MNYELLIMNYKLRFVYLHAPLPCLAIRHEEGRHEKADMQTERCLRT